MLPPQVSRRISGVPVRTSNVLSMWDAPKVASRPTTGMDLVQVLNSEQVPWAVRFALELQRLGSHSELDALFLLGSTLWLESGECSPEAIARKEWAAWPR